MSKQFNSVSELLFGTPVPYAVPKPYKTVIVSASRDADGSSVIEHVCVEDLSSKTIQLNFSDVALSTLVANGIEPHSLDMIDVSKLGIDRNVDSIANYIVSHSDEFVVRGDSYNKSEK